ncbi:MAG: class I SAM-dependent methyltransferase [Planctomycetes bacterium]|nr:class I SAM-dependent methyltransferase [Planctomycetota bacterium]
MSQTRTPATWEEHYQTGNLPWDSGSVDEDLPHTLDLLKLHTGNALEIGCGTGTHAIALAKRGFTGVTATDVSPKAIEMARAKARDAGAATIDFKVHDILASAPAPAGWAQFVFDRGVFHSVSDGQRPIFARRVADALAPGGWWLTLCGNADDKTPGGPPRLTAAHIAGVVEPLFEVHAIDRSNFHKIKQSASDHFTSWRVVLRKR